MYGTTVSDHPTRSCSLHPDSMKVRDKPPGNHLRSIVVRPSKQIVAHRSTTGVAPTFEIPPLPPTLSLKKIYADLLGYLFDHSTPTLPALLPMLTLTKARGYFKKYTVDGASIWTRLGHQVIICLATPNGWDISQQVRLSHPSMTMYCVDNDTWYRLSFVKRASSVGCCQRTTTNPACASLLRVKPQYIMPSTIPNQLNGFARGLYSLLSMLEGLLSTRPCTSAKMSLPSSSSRKSVRVSAYRPGVCLSIAQLSTCSWPSCKVAGTVMKRISKKFYESSRGRPSGSMTGPRCPRSSSLVGSAEIYP